MTQPQRFCIAGVTGTHPLALARQLDARSLLQTYYTTLPKSRTSGVTSARTRRHRALLLPILASNRRWIRGRGNTRLQLWWGYEFDRWIAKRLEPGDVVHALPGCGLELRRAAKRRFGAMTVCDSGTSHERFLADLLDEETKKWGVPRHRGPESHLRYVEAEYDEADIITVPSGFARNSFVSMGVDPAKVRVTPYGAELRDYAPTTKRDDVFRILFVGTVCIRKGVQYLLEAVSQLKLPNAELCIRGADAPETAQLLRAYRGSIPLRRVEPAPRAAMKDLYSQASVFVLPSVEDGFGHVICEAMACGVPVIASRNSGGPDVITDGRDGVLVDARSSRAIRDHLLELYEHPAKRQAMGAAARRAIERVGGWSGYADSFIAACAPSSDRRAGL